MANWSYTFCDLLSGRELATLPMQGVSFSEELCEVGALAGMVPTVDPEVRAMDPWAATEPRRTAVFVECDDEVVWGGIVWGRSRDQSTYGLRLTAATFDSFLKFMYLRSDYDFRGLQLGPQSISGSLIGGPQTYPGADINLVPGWTGDGTGETRLEGHLYKATDVKNVADHLASFQADNATVVEWRVDLAKINGQYTKTLHVIDDKLTGPVVTEDVEAFGTPPRVWPAAPLELHYPGDLLTWTDTEDGSVRGNAVIGSATGPTIGGEPVKLLSVVTAPDVGSEELAAGFPLITTAYSVGGTNITQATLDRAVRNRLISQLVQGHVLSNITVRAHEPALHTYRPGWRVDMSITHPAWREWPAETSFPGYRIRGRRVTVGDGDQADKVSLTVIPPSSMIPESTSLAAHLKKMEDRLRELETP